MYGKKCYGYKQIFPSPKIDTKGLSTVRRDTPPFVKAAQSVTLNTMLTVDPKVVKAAMATWVKKDKLTGKVIPSKKRKRESQTRLVGFSIAKEDDADNQDDSKKISSDSSDVSVVAVKRQKLDTDHITMGIERIPTMEEDKERERV